jgi:murein DD-endopeptidase MepM/ murein hydrolase activator NlpD
MHNPKIPFRRDRRNLLAVMGITAATTAFAPSLHAQRRRRNEPEPEENLEEQYAETERLVSAGSTADRPGLASWQQPQGRDLVWPAKYYLPYPAGMAHQVYQGWNGHRIGPPRATHMQAQNYYAWDFHIVRGQYICAARDGTVEHVHDSEPAGNENANTIRIRHADDEVSVYAHVGSGTALVSVGDRVLAGQRLCQGSNESMHLHFVIWKNMIDYPCRFIDVANNNGVPQYGQHPASGNRGPDGQQIADIERNYQRGEAAFQEKDYVEALKFFLAATAVEVRVEAYEAALERIEECRQLIDAEVDEAVTEAKSGDFDGAERRLEAIRRKYGDYAKERIDEALKELQDNPEFRDWVNRQRAERLWIEARRAEKFEEWDAADRAYRQLRRLYDRNDPESAEIRDALTRINMARILED